MNCRKCLLATIFTTLTAVSLVSEALAAPMGRPATRKQVKELANRLEALELQQSKSITTCRTLAHQERFNRGGPGAILKLQVSCPNPAATMIDAGYAVYQNLDPSGAAPLAGELIASRVFKQQYSDSNADLSPDTFNLVISADENFWVDIDVYCCEPSL